MEHPQARGNSTLSNVFSCRQEDVFPIWRDADPNRDHNARKEAKQPVFGWRERPTRDITAEVESDETLGFEGRQ